MQIKLLAALVLLVAALLPVAAPAQEATGIAACDQFFTKYQACANTRPPTERQALERGIGMMRNLIKGRLARGDARTAIESECKEFDAEVKKEAAQLKCAW